MSIQKIILSFLFYLRRFSFLFLLSPLFLAAIPVEASYLPATGSNIGIGTSAPVGGLVVMNGNVGIGTWSPTSKLQVIGSVNATAFVGDGSGLVNVTGTNSGWTDGGTNVYTSTTTDNIGIGTTTPNAATLEIVKNAAQAPLRISSAAAGAGDFFQIDSRGGAGIGTTKASPITNLTVMNGNVGIGTWNATAKLNVKFGAGSEAPLLVAGTSNGTALQIDSNGWLTTASTSVAGSGQTAINFGNNLSQVNHSTADFMMINPAAVPNGNLLHVRVGSSDEKLLLVNNGSLGLGTISPVGGTAFMNGNVGIGTWSPNNGLEVKGVNAAIISTGGTNANATGPGELYVQGDLEVDGTIYGDGSGITGVSGITAAGGWTDGGPNVYTSATTDNVGIGTTTPSSTVEIVKTAAGTAPLMVSTVATGDGNLFIVNSVGQVGIGTTLMSPATGSSIMNGNLGIGTWNATTALTVKGTLTAGINTSATLADSTLTLSGVQTLNIANFVIQIGTTSTPYYFPGAGMGIGTNAPGSGVAVMTGNVGIGTWSSPANSLSIADGNIGIGTYLAYRRISAPNNGMVMEGNLGVGTWNPSTKVQVVGTVTATAFAGDGSALTNLPANGGWTDGGTNVYTSATTDNVGIGTTTPNAATLEIVKNAAQAPLRVSSAATGAGDFLNVTSAGLVGIGTTLNSPSTGLAVMNGNVGIGTWAPGNVLTVAGGASIGSGAGYKTTAAPADSLLLQGNLGIGTFLPQTFVHIVDANPQIRIQRQASSGNSLLQFQRTAIHTDWGLQTAANRTDLSFVAGDTAIERLTIAQSGNVGMGTTSTNAALSVMNGNIGIGTWDTSGVSGALIVANGADANVGIGTIRPGAKLDVNGIIRSITGGVTYPDGTTQTTAYLGSASAGGWTDGGTNVYTATTTDNVGIGTTTPNAATFEIVKNAAQPLMKLSSTATSSGDMLNVNSSGSLGIGTTLASPLAKIVVFGGNVGIGTWNPIRNLEVVGGIYASQSVQAGNATFSSTQLQLSNASGNAVVNNGNTAVNSHLLLQSGTGAGSSILFKTGTSSVEAMRIDALGNVGLGTTLQVGGLAIMNGNVGIGTWSPNNGLEVKGVNAAVISTGGANTNATGPGELYVQGDLEVDGTIYGDGSGITGASGITAAGGWTDGGVNVYLSATTDTVGIGTTTPSTTLEIVKQGSSAPLMVSSVPTGDGNLLKIDSSGNVGLGTTGPVGGLVVMNGNVGVGTWSPTSGLQMLSSFAVYQTATAASTTTGGQTVIGVTDTSAARTITLATADMRPGRVVIIKDESGGAGTNNVTVATEGGEKIDGEDEVTITSDYGVVKMYSNGSNWYTF